MLFVDGIKRAFSIITNNFITGTNNKNFGFLTRKVFSLIDLLKTIDLRESTSFLLR